MDADNWISAAGVVVALGIGYLSVDGVTLKSQARRRAKAAADVVAALPENSEAHRVALGVAEVEVERWRVRATPTSDEKQSRWARTDFTISLVNLIIVTGVLLSVVVEILARDDSKPTIFDDPRTVLLVLAVGALQVGVSAYRSHLRARRPASTGR